LAPSSLALVCGGLVCGGLACGGAEAEPVVATASPMQPGASARGAGSAQAASGSRPTVAEAARFMDDVETELRRLFEARDRAMWVNMNFITDDTEALGAAAEERTAAFVTKSILAATRFDAIKSEMPAELARKFTLLRLAQVVPAPEDPKKREELARIEVEMAGAYGKGKYCPPAGSVLGKKAAARKAAAAPHAKAGDAKAGDACFNLEELSNILTKSRNEPELREAWEGWHATSSSMKPKYARYVELGNEGARGIGFADMGALWRAGYDMSPEAFEADIDRLWKEIQPFYEELHCFARAKLRAKYGKAVIGDKALIPAHLLGNMWSQEWQGLMDMLAPYPGEPKLDATPLIKAKKIEPKEMVRIGERFFTSLGFHELPKTFWERSLFVRPRDREVVCHASAWDVDQRNDLRLKMCIEPTDDDLVTIHHELGHIFYYQSYETLPILFEAGANDGFHEAIGDTIALSITPDYLKSIGLLGAVPKNDHVTLNVQMKMALSKVAFLPFGLLIDKWRWDVFSGKTPTDRYNAAWWALKKKYQGVAPPGDAARGDDFFDPGAKYHIPASTPYVRYFLSHVYQFQFYRALCRAAGHTGPLHTCSVFGNAAAGEKLRAMLALGASKPWPEAMAAIGAEPRADASALLEYFAPLRAYLEAQTKGETCGW
jgi:peptidyl-dipeptidase A